MINDEVFEKNKKFFRQYRRYHRHIERLENRLYELDRKLETIHAVKLTGLPKGGLPRDLSDSLQQREELENRINNLVAESNPIKNKILSVIDHQDNDVEAQVLEMFFIEDIQLDVIAKQLHYSMRQIKRLYGNSVRNASGIG